MLKETYIRLTITSSIGSRGAEGPGEGKKIEEKIGLSAHLCAVFAATYSKFLLMTFEAKF